METGADLQKVICCVPYHQIKKNQIFLIPYSLNTLSGDLPIISLIITYCNDNFPLNKNSHLAILPNTV